MEFKVWINQKYLEFRGDSYGRESSVSAFARFIGVAQQVADDWLKGNTLPSHRATIDKLVARYGIEAYDVLGIEYNSAEEIASLIRATSEDERQQLLKVIEGWARDHGYGYRAIDTDSPVPEVQNNHQEE